MINNIKDLLILHEGVRQFPYEDTVGKVTIGVGFNLTDVGLLPEEIDFILENRINRTKAEVHEAFPWFSSLDEVRQAVVVDMAYNMGLPVLKQFRNTLAYIQEGNYTAAARNMLMSKWAQQVKGRAKRLARMMETGLWPE